MLSMKLTLFLSLSLATVFLPTIAQAGTGSTKQSVQAGEQVFTQRCFQCHSVLPDQVKFGPSLSGEMRNSPHKKTAAQIRMILRDGKNKMPSFKDILTNEDTDHLLSYLHSL